MSIRKSASQIHDDLTAAWVQFKERGSAAARDFIIEHYRYLISKTRQRIIPSVPTKIAPEDLEQEGLIALVKAVDQFEPSRGVKFESYAISMVRGAMLEYLRKEDWVPRSVRTKQKMLARAEEALTHREGRGRSPMRTARTTWSWTSTSSTRSTSRRPVMQIVSLEDVVGDTEHEDLDPLVVLESVRSADPDPHTTTIVNEQRQHSPPVRPVAAQAGADRHQDVLLSEPDPEADRQGDQPLQVAGAPAPRPGDHAPSAASSTRNRASSTTRGVGRRLPGAGARRRWLGSKRQRARADRRRSLAIAALP